MSDSLPTHSDTESDGTRPTWEEERAASWRCEDCRCINATHEAFCFRCGAGQPEDDDA